MKDVNSVCLLGFGEVGQMLAGALGETGLTLGAVDQQFSDPHSGPSRAAAGYSRLGAAIKGSEGIAGADLVISAVTADQNRAAAAAVASGLKPGAWFLDVNSVSPTCKREVAALIEKSGGRYVEAAIMSPVYPRGIAVPILLGGPEAEEFLPVAQSLGFTGARFFDPELGKAAASKMCRSVLVKGLESLLVEALLSARAYGVEDTVLDSLGDLMPGVDWKQHAAYMVGRSLEHGKRRAEEMQEVALTVRDAGIAPRMSRACADTQLWTARFKDASNETTDADPLLPVLDEILRSSKTGN